MRSTTDNYIKLSHLLVKEFEFVETSQQLIDTISERRFLFRSFFSMVEGQNFVRKQIALDLYENRNIKFTHAELALL